MHRLLLTSALILVSHPLLHGKEPAAVNVGQAMTMAAQAFLASLDEPQLAKATRAFDDPARLDWHNIPKPNRKGLPLHDMNANQRALCFKLLQAALSDSGYDKASKIMSLENNLREGEKGIQGAPLRDPDRYYLTIFGKPESEGLWGWSFEGSTLLFATTARSAIRRASGAPTRRRSRSLSTTDRTSARARWPRKSR
jgi:hypothetical protein